MTDLAISVSHLSKQYRIGSYGSIRYATLRDALVGVAGSPARLVGRLSRRKALTAKTEREALNHIWALRDISFDVRQGQVLGIIGRNGAGKSTLLKILARVTDPTEGVGEIRGRVGSLLEVGTGFHPELTGRENIYLNGAILGMKRTEIERKFDEIVAFSEVEMFIDTPVKRYSSGMYLRLAFAVAAHLEPEILVIDEVLAVGDAEFQRKCLGKISNVAQEGRTVLFVSHNMSAILRLTQETLVIEKGQLAMRAPTAQAVDYYLSRGDSKQGERVWEPDEIPTDAAPYMPVGLRVLNRTGSVSDSVRSTDPVTVEVEYCLASEITGLRVGIYLMSTRGEMIFTSFDTDDPDQFEHFTSRKSGRYVSRCVIPADFLNEGRYVLGMNASSFRVRRYFQDEQALTFTVDAAGAPGTQWPEPRLGAVRPRLDWKIKAV